MAPAVAHLHKLVARNAKVFKAAWRKAVYHVQNQLPASVRPTQAELQPIFARNATKHPLHRVAALKQSKGRWYSTHSRINATVRRFTTAALRSSGVKFDRASFPKSTIGDAVIRQTGRSPFASTLRPNLTGGTLSRTAGGYAWGSGRAGGARYFSHGPAAPAQVINNVSQAVRAFLVGGQKAQFDGIDPRTGEKRFKCVSALQDQVNRTLNKAPKTTPGSYISFNINPTVTALSPLAAVKGFGSFAQEKQSLNRTLKKAPKTTPGSYISFNINPTVTALSPLAAVKGFGSFAREKQSLNQDGLLDVLSVDFSRAVKELAAVLADLQRLSTLGDLPITYEASTLRVHFPGCDAETVERICDELNIQRGSIFQDADFDSFVGTEIALLFPFAPSRTPSECSFFDKDVSGRQYPIEWRQMMTPSVLSSDSDHYSTHSENGMDFDLLDEGNPWLSSSSPSGYESLHVSEAEDEMDLHTPLEYQGFEGIYRFMEQCESSR